MGEVTGIVIGIGTLAALLWLIHRFDADIAYKRIYVAAYALTGLFLLVIIGAISSFAGGVIVAVAVLTAYHFLGGFIIETSGSKFFRQGHATLLLGPVVAGFAIRFNIIHHVVPFAIMSLIISIVALVVVKVLFEKRNMALFETTVKELSARCIDGDPAVLLESAVYLADLRRRNDVFNEYDFVDRYSSYTVLDDENYDMTNVSQIINMWLVEAYFKGYNNQVKQKGGLRGALIAAFIEYRREFMRDYNELIKKAYTNDAEAQHNFGVFLHKNTELSTYYNDFTDSHCINIRRFFDKDDNPGDYTAEEITIAGAEKRFMGAKHSKEYSARLNEIKRLNRQYLKKFDIADAEKVMRLLLRGLGVQYIDARIWLGRAARQGYKPAISKLGSIRKEMDKMREQDIKADKANDEARIARSNAAFKARNDRAFANISSAMSGGYYDRSSSRGSSSSSDRSASSSSSSTDSANSPLLMAGGDRVKDADSNIVGRHEGGVYKDASGTPRGRLVGNMYQDEHGNTIGWRAGNVILDAQSKQIGRIEGGVIKNNNSETIGRVE